MSSVPLALPLRVRARVRPVVGLVGVPVALVLAFVATNVSASLAQRGLEREWAARLDASRGSSRNAPAVGDPVARIVVPSIGLDAIVVEGAAPAQMRRGPAHLPSTPLPGEQGTAIITANRLGFGGFFADIDRLAPGDRIFVETLGGRRAFVVTSIRVLPAEALDLEGDGTAPALMLFGSARRWGGGDRVVVRAVEGG